MSGSYRNNKLIRTGVGFLNSPPRVCSWKTLHINYNNQFVRYMCRNAKRDSRRSSCRKMFSQTNGLPRRIRMVMNDHRWWSEIEFEFYFVYLGPGWQEKWMIPRWLDFARHSIFQHSNNYVFFHQTTAVCHLMNISV